MDGMLKQYIEECAKLPVDLKKNFDLIREIDIVVEQKADLIQQKLITLTKSHRGLSKDAQCAINKEINVSFEIFDKILSLSEKKLKLATLTYNVVDNQIVRLDRDSEKVQASVKRRHEPEEERHKKKRKHLSRKSGKNQTDVELEPSTSSTYDQVGTAPVIDLPIDPNEPVYCVCRQVSFGNMVMCDNKDCPIEWFHFGCVGLKETPKGKWYCSRCFSEKCKKKSTTHA
ncbi:unnamed protein product [Enterobius vermicularis]|uniref:Inhibitor of growth protein n=1 Tax=Enterobius vermicularis TaxID=51028 RepID=A0A0N4VK19_ENTVE|nr:unnamed protein product [Enterobius vermicularis]